MSRYSQLRKMVKEANAIRTEALNLRNRETRTARMEEYSTRWVMILIMAGRVK